MSSLLHKELTGKIIGAYYTAYNKLSQTYPEYIYEQAMMTLLEQDGTRCVQQDSYEVRYKEQIVGRQTLDILVADTVIVELKVANEITPLHLAQLLSYLKATAKETGLLLRFGGPGPDFARRVFTQQKWQETVYSTPIMPTERDDLLHPELVYEIISSTLEVFEALGPGFVHRIYANACYYELKLRGFDVQPHQEFRVFLDTFDLGGIKFGHLQIDNRVLLFPIAISNLENINLENIKAWMRYLNIPIGIIVNFKAIWLEPVILRI